MQQVSLVRLVPFAEEDLVRIFDDKTMQRARVLMLRGAVQLDPDDKRIEAKVSDSGRELDVVVTPMKLGPRVLFDRSCGCGRSVCAHTAATAMTVLETRPQWRRPVQASLLDGAVPVVQPIPLKPPQAAAPAQAPAPKPVPAPALGGECVAVWTIEPGSGGAALFITAHLCRIGSDGQPAKEGIPATPRLVIDRTTKAQPGDLDRAVARMLGAGGLVRTPIPKDKKYLVDTTLKRLAGSGRLRWRDGAALAAGPVRTVRGVKDAETGKIRPTNLPEGGMLLRGESWWCVDPKSGRIGRAELQIVSAPAPATAKSGPAPAPPGPKGRVKETPKAGVKFTGGSARSPASSSSYQPPPTHARPTGETAEIVDRVPKIILRLGKAMTPDQGMVDALRVGFDYGDEANPSEIEADDLRQFAKIILGSGKSVFARRDRGVEQGVLDRLAQAGLVQFRVASLSEGPEEKAVRFHGFRGRDAAEKWHAFVTGGLASGGLPALAGTGCDIRQETDFGGTVVEPDNEIAMGVADAGDGWFDLDIGIEIDGVRRPLVPILTRLIETGGLDPSRVIDGKIHTMLEDGRVLALPAERTLRLLSVFDAVLDSGYRVGEKLRVPIDEADNLLGLEELQPRPGESARIAAYLTRLREDEVPLGEAMPAASFQGELRPYQRQGLAWLQRLRGNGLSGCLSDDMGLGKTAQTIAHIVTEHDAGRLTEPALVVVPTSLVPNWEAELARFAPHLQAVVMHGIERHQRWDAVARSQIVVTTYAILVRDIEAMKARSWSIVVLDEAQAIKNPDSKATRAACSLAAQQRLCLSGTPVENNLEELWSQFVFLMPGLLGDRKSFNKRYRVPIEKRADKLRAVQFSRRIRPFLLRRTKADVAADLPPKTEMVCRVELDAPQRDLYEAIRLSMHERVREAIASQGLARSRITVLDALLKLRQSCCDPRLVKLPLAEAVTSSTKLEALIEMLKEMIPEGRRILVFSQFTSMLALMKPELDAAEIPYVELTGSTADRQTPVKRFQAGEVPVFLISLKAGGRGLNLTAADTVIHYDPWWNPAAEAQATDRAHRIGQDKPVFVYKLIASETVEEKILELQRRKSSLADAALNGGEFDAAFSGDDVDYLFAD